MRKIAEVFRLSFEGQLGLRAIAQNLRISPSTVGDYLRRARAAGLSWPLPVGLDEAALERRLFPAPRPSRQPRPLPVWADVHRELKRKGVTLTLLWAEYKTRHLEGLQYTHSAHTTAPGPGRLMWSCANRTGPEKSFLSIMPGRRSRSSTA